MITNCLGQMLLSVVEYLTKFATIWAAIRGGSFLDSGRGVTELLKRNAIDSLRVWCAGPPRRPLLPRRRGAMGKRGEQGRGKGGARRPSSLSRVLGF